MKTISIVIPCYNSEKSVEKVINDSIETIKKDGRYDYEIVCVNDGSKDNTISVLKGLAKKNKKIKVINLLKNFGQHSALMAGFNNVSGDYILTLDDDGQNPPSSMFKLIDKMISEDYDLVSAKYSNRKESLYRRLGSRLSMFMSRTLIGLPKGIELNSYCCFKRIIADEITKYKNAFPFVHGLMLRVTRNIANVEMPHNEREIGKSGYSFGKLVSLWLNGFTAFSVKPLRIASLCGAFISFCGFIYGIAVIIKKISNPGIVVGYSSMMSILLFTSGMIMLMLGLIGEYIGRIYISINDSPQYAIRETINIKDNK